MSLIGNITHAVLPYVPHVVIQIGAAAVPPTALLAAVHGIALAVRAGASGRVYCWTVGAVATIGIGAFAASFLALRDLMQAIGYSSTTALYLPGDRRHGGGRQHPDAGALGDKPVRRARTVTTLGNTQTPREQRVVQSPTQGTKAQVTSSVLGGKRVPASASLQPEPAQPVQSSVQTAGAQDSAECAQADADLASD